MSDCGARRALRLRISALEASLATARERRAGGAEEHQRFDAIAHAIQRAREILDGLDGATIDHRVARTTAAGSARVPVAVVAWLYSVLTLAIVGAAC